MIPTNADVLKAGLDHFVLLVSYYHLHCNDLLAQWNMFGLQDHICLMMETSNTNTYSPFPTYLEIHNDMVLSSSLSLVKVYKFNYLKRLVTLFL